MNKGKHEERSAYLKALITFSKSEEIKRLPLSELGYSKSEEANRFVFENPLAFVLGLIFDQSISSDLAWESPMLLSKRLGHLDVNKISLTGKEELTDIIRTKRSLHRYPSVVAKYIISSCVEIVSQFNGDASNIWLSKDINLAKKNFLQMKGIGEKKANLAILMLARDGKVQFDNIEGLPLALDVHLKRVLKRSGLFDVDTKDGVSDLHACFKQEKSDFPALLGTPIWIIGRKYCHKTVPQCSVCPLDKKCLKYLENE